MDPYTINIELPKEDCNIGNKIKSIFNKTYPKTLYEQGDEHGNPIVYKKLYNDIVDGTIPKNKQLTVMSMDSSVTSAIMTALTRRYMYSEKVKGQTQFRSNLKVIYIDSHPDNTTKINRDFEGFSSSVLSNAMSQINPTYTDHDLNIYPEQVMIFGIDNDHMDDESNDRLLQLNIPNYSLKTIRKKGIENILNNTVERYNDCADSVFVSIDLSVLEPTSCPSVYRTDYKNRNGLNHKEYFEVLKSLKKINNLVGLCITGYDFSLGKDNKMKDSCDMLTSSVIRETLTNLTNLKEKSINIFNENTYFLIWRYLEDDDYGWYILRNCSLEFREELISKRLTDDSIITEEIIDNEDGEIITVMISKTTMKDQELKSYYTGGVFSDCILYPHEKVSMMFEMLNTPQTQVNGE